MSSTPYMQLWVSDFLGDTLDLDAKEIGAYILLLMALWQRGGTLPDDQSKLKRVARVGRDWPKVWASLQRYFVARNGSISNPRLTKELLKVDAKRTANAHSGALGGRAKALKDKERGLADASVSLQHTRDQIPEREKREAKASPKKKSSRLSESWSLPKDWGEWALNEGWAELVVRAEAEKFRDFWVSKPGKDGTKLDWQATWRNWMRNSKSPKVINGDDYGKPPKNTERLNAFVSGARGSS